MLFVVFLEKLNSTTRFWTIQRIRDLQTFKDSDYGFWKKIDGYKSI